MGHVPSHEHERVIPLLVGDYFFVRSTGDEVLHTCLAMRLYPYKIVLACAVPRKGMDPSVVSMIVKILRDVGLVHFAYRCDREKSLNAMIEQACIESGRRGSHDDSENVPSEFEYPVAPIDDDEPDAPTVQILPDKNAVATTATPELTHPGGSQSNGLAESSVRTIEEQARTMLAALQTHLRLGMPASHPLLAWLVQHSAYVLNKYQVGKDGHTAFGRLHGKETRERLAEFGENSPLVCAIQIEIEAGSKMALRRLSWTLAVKRPEFYRCAWRGCHSRQSHPSRCTWATMGYTEASLYFNNTFNRIHKAIRHHRSS